MLWKCCVRWVSYRLCHFVDVPTCPLVILHADQMLSYTFVMQAAGGQALKLNGQIISDVTVQRSKETTMRLANEGLGACH